ncbi:MAG: tRNA (guanine(46)-N(7))-methyltransferase, partial [uncultured Friedmanniella sp.]
ERLPDRRTALPRPPSGAPRGRLVRPTQCADAAQPAAGLGHPRRALRAAGAAARDQHLDRPPGTAGPAGGLRPAGAAGGGGRAGTGRVAGGDGRGPAGGRRAGVRGLRARGRLAGQRPAPGPAGQRPDRGGKRRRGPAVPGAGGRPGRAVDLLPRPVAEGPAPQAPAGRARARLAGHQPAPSRRQLAAGHRLGGLRTADPRRAGRPAGAGQPPPRRLGTAVGRPAGHPLRTARPRRRPDRARPDLPPAAPGGGV